MSGGASLISGNPWSGNIFPWSEVFVKVGIAVSGLVYVGVALDRASGGLTMNSGGALTSGGIADGVELRPGDSFTIPRLLCSGNPDKIMVGVPTAISGTMRIYWTVR